MKNQPYSINALSELTGLDRRRLKKELRDVETKKTKAGTEGFDLGAALRALFVAADAAGNDTPEIQSERLRMLKAQANRQELSLSRERAEVVSVEEVFLIFSDIALRARAKFLQLPQLSATLDGKTGGEIRTALDNEVHKILNELAQLDAQPTLDAIRAAARGETPNNRKAA